LLLLLLLLPLLLLLLLLLSLLLLHKVGPSLRPLQQPVELGRGRDAHVNARPRLRGVLKAHPSAGQKQALAPPDGDPGLPRQPFTTTTTTTTTSTATDFVLLVRQPAAVKVVAHNGTAEGSAVNSQLVPPARHRP